MCPKNSNPKSQNLTNLNKRAFFVQSGGGKVNWQTKAADSKVGTVSKVGRQSQTIEIYLFIVIFIYLFIPAVCGAGVPYRKCVQSSLKFLSSGRC